MSNFNKYRVGQKVMFIAKPDYCSGAKEDSGKIVTITELTDVGWCGIFIEGSKNNEYAMKIFPDRKVTWCVPEDTLKLMPNQQLLFDFM